MKPLSEWTADELRSAIVRPHIFGVFELTGMMGELLRRERERCAKECERLIVEGPAVSPAMTAWYCSTRIRGLQ